MNRCVEIVCSSADDCVKAEQGGASRIELCAALPLGGITPSLGLLMEARVRTRLPVMAMVRPRQAGFLFSEGQFAEMERDTDLFAAHGTEGIVTGILNEDGTVDVRRCRRLIERAGPMEKVFHRAFDVVPDPFEALEALIDLGFTRILTSGRRDTALQGADLIREVRERADGRIEILPGGGITPETAREVSEKTGCEWVHLAVFESVTDASTRANPELTFGAGNVEEGFYTRTDAEAVRRTVQAVS